MFTYYYRVVTKDRSVRDGNVKAFSKRYASQKCLTEGEMLIDIQKVKGKDLFEKLKHIHFGFSKFEQIIFFRNMSAMLNSGISLVLVLNILSRLVKGTVVKKIILLMEKDVRDNGMQLSGAMAKHPIYFPLEITETIRLGEITGTLAETLERISLDLENDYELSRQVLRALLYPIIIIAAMVVLIVVLLVYVLPKITILYHELGAELPLFTKILISIAAFLTGNTILILAGLILCVFSFYLLLRKEWGRYALDSAVLHIPIVEKIIKEFNRVRFFRALKTISESGISWVEGIDIARHTIKNEVYKRATITIYPIVLHGGTLSQALTPYPELFPLQTQQMILIGEQAGTMIESLRNVTFYHEKALEHLTKIITVLIEPVLMIIMGLIVGSIALSIFLPIYNLSNVI